MSPSSGAAHHHLGLALEEDLLGRDELRPRSAIDGHSALSCERLGLGQHALDAADVEERLLGHVVELAVDQRLERLRPSPRPARRCPCRPVNTSPTKNGWRQEPLDLAGPGHRHPVLLGELVETEDGDDVLELLVALQHLLHPPGARRSGARPTISGARMFDVDASGSTAG